MAIAVSEFQSAEYGSLFPITANILRTHPQDVFLFWQDWEYITDGHFTDNTPVTLLTFLSLGAYITLLVLTLRLSS